MLTVEDGYSRFFQNSEAELHHISEDCGVKLKLSFYRIVVCHVNHLCRQQPWIMKGVTVHGFTCTQVQEYVNITKVTSLNHVVAALGQMVASMNKK